MNSVSGNVKFDLDSGGILKTKSRLSLLLLASALSSTWMVSGGSALAQEAAAQASSGVVLEEIIVTARKRQESLQDTPIAVTALNAEALAERHVVNIADVGQLAPNVQIDSAV